MLLTTSKAKTGMVETFQNFDTRNPNSLNHLKIQEIDSNLQAQSVDQHAGTVAALFPIPAIVPLKGKECRACGKTGHYAKVCRSTPKRRDVRNVTNSPVNDPDYVYTV